MPEQFDKLKSMFNGTLSDEDRDAIAKYIDANPQRKALQQSQDWAQNDPTLQNMVSGMGGVGSIESQGAGKLLPFLRGEAQSEAPQVGQWLSNGTKHVLTTGDGQKVVVKPIPGLEYGGHRIEHTPNLTNPLDTRLYDDPNLDLDSVKGFAKSLLGPHNE